MKPHAATHFRFTWRSPVKAIQGLLASCLIAIAASAQTAPTAPRIPPIADADLDPARTIASPQLESAMHQPLPEQYIWTREDAISEKPNINGSWTSEGNTHLDP